MAIYLSSTQINRVYFTSSDVKAICLQNDSNRIYPNEINYYYEGNGYYEQTIVVPTGYTTLNYTATMDDGSMEYLTLDISQSSGTLVNETMMSGSINGTAKITSGNLYIVIDCPLSVWSLSLTLKS